MVTAPAKRELVRYMALRGLSERQALRLAHMSSSAGVLQGSCRDSRVFYAAIFSVGCSLSGLSVTAPMGCQFRVLLDQRCGF